MLSDQHDAILAPVISLLFLSQSHGARKLKTTVFLQIVIWHTNEIDAIILVNIHAILVGLREKSMMKTDSKFEFSLNRLLTV